MKTSPHPINSQPSLGDLMDLSRQLGRDAEASGASLRHRDREIGRELAALEAHPVTQLLGWLQRVRDRIDDLRGDKVNTVYRLGLLVLAVAGLLAGWGTAAVVFRYDGTHPVNVIHVVVVFVLVQLVTLVFFGLGLLPPAVTRFMPGMRTVQESLGLLSPGRLQHLFARYLPQAYRDTATALLGKGLAARLNAGIGDEVVIVSQAADGSIANDLYTVTGFVDSGDEMSDQMAMYLHLADAQELFVLEGRVHEIAIISSSIRGLARTSGEIAQAINRPELTVEPWQVFAKSFYDAMTADQKGNWISLAIITLLVAIGVLNTVLMTVLERTREYGLMRAIGTSPWMVFRLVLTEVSLMAVMSVIAGAVIATGVNYWLSINGVAMPTSIDFGGMTFSHAYTEINVRSYVIPLLCVILSAIFISVIPALKAARTQPATAMRYH